MQDLRGQLFVLRNAYQNTMLMLQQARSYESDGQRREAFVAYTAADGWWQKLNDIWPYAEGKEEEAHSIVEGLPAKNEVDDMRGQIYDGLERLKEYKK